MEIELRETNDDDLAVFWEQLTHPELRRMAALTRKYHHDRGHFDAHWAKVRNDPAVTLRTVLADRVVVGHAAVFGPPGEREVTYVIGPGHWGRGIATRALAELIRLEDTRPLHAGAVSDNAGSIRVLEKCGFVLTGRTRDYARARGEEVDVVLLTLH
ncbi:GNAT family N-acetyltransferase [Streptomyces sp. NBC_01232]|uniref:GNAT family N-acetyltransferase n=1 Tax=Streptomyces sp. NBC_01232 TaxID=2903786 RepID=UPI002E0ED224|nr:GNAT family N-acetyltransferase [Streptomyces sp. NBC_01232]